MRPKVHSRLSGGATTTSVTNTDAQKTLNHKVAKRQKQPLHQLRVHLLPRLSRAGLSGAGLESLPSIRHRFGPPTRRKEREIPQ